MSRYLGFLLVVILTLLPNCSANGVDSQKALALGDLFMNDVINDRREEIYSRMESEFHDLTSKDQFVNGLDTLYEQVGKPNTFELASYGVGVRVLTSGQNVGQTKPTCEVIYRVTTTKGLYPLKVKFVNSGDGLAVTFFSFILPN